MPRKRSYTRKRPDWKPVFLKALAATGLVGRSAEIAGVHLSNVYRARDLTNRTGHNLAQAQKFIKDWDLALESVADRVETEMFRRAIEGAEQSRDIYYKGEKVGTQTVKTYSDRLLMFIAKAYRPSRFGRHWGLPGQPESTPDPDSTFDLREDFEKVAQQRWEELRPRIAERLALAAAESSENNAILEPPLANFPPQISQESATSTASSPLPNAQGGGTLANLDTPPSN